MARERGFAVSRATSRAAHQRTFAYSAGQKRSLLAAIYAAANAGHIGRACYELHHVCGGKHESTSAALNAMMREGVIRDSGSVRSDSKHGRSIIWEPGVGGSVAPKQGTLL